LVPWRPILITGGGNTAVGARASDNQSGNYNIALGYAAGTRTTGSNNIVIGDIGVEGESNTIRIGGDGFGGGPQTAAFIAGISGTAVVGDAVVVDGNGQLGTVASSARFKKNIKPMDKTSEAILALKPVSFQYRSDSKGTPQFGLIAEEVAKVNPDLVVRNRNDEIYSVRYEAVNAMLLNEFLKEHRTVQDLKSTVAKQEATIAQQQTSFQSKLAEQESQIEALTAGLQKVSAQLELSKPAPQISTVCRTEIKPRQGVAANTLDLFRNSRWLHRRLDEAGRTTGSAEPHRSRGVSQLNRYRCADRTRGRNKDRADRDKVGE
jgi:hypothetical protein